MSGAKVSKVGDELYNQSRWSSIEVLNLVGKGLMDDVPAHHLMFTIWAATQTYMPTLVGGLQRYAEENKLDDKDWKTAEFITQLVIKRLRCEKLTVFEGILFRSVGAGLFLFVQGDD